VVLVHQRQISAKEWNMKSLSYLVGLFAMAALMGCGTPEPEDTSLNRGEVTIEQSVSEPAAEEMTSSSLQTGEEELSAGKSCRCVARCSLWKNSEGTYYNGKFLYCGCI
jgi:hypothetical protein